MASDNVNELTTKALTVLVAGAAGAATTALGSDVTTTTIAASTAFAALPAAFGYVMEHIVHKFQKRCEDFWNQFVQAYESWGLQGAAMLIEARLEEPAVQESVYEAFRRLSETHDEVGVRPLALLTAEYVAEGKRPDRFLRSAGALLADITADEYDELARMLIEVSSAEAPYERVELHGMKIDGVLRLCVAVKYSGKIEDDFIVLGQYTQITELFDLIKKHGLGSEAASGFVGHTSGPHVIVAEKSVLRRLNTYFGPVTHAATGDNH